MIGAIDPVAFEIFGLSIRWYAIFITTGMILCMIGATLEAKRRKINPDIVLEIFIWCVPIAILMARLVYVFAHPHIYLPINNMEDFKQLFRINEGGLTIIGGIIGGIIGAIILSRYRRVNFLELADFGIPFLLLGQAIGRWGNYINQEAYGMVVKSEFFQRFPLGVFIDRTGQWHYAAFFYEMVLNYIGFALLYIIGRKTNKRGIVTIGYFIWYGVVRGLLEFIRLDAVMVNGVSITQIGCFIAAAFGILLIILIQTGKINLGITNNLVVPRVESTTYYDEKIVKDFTNKVENNETSIDGIEAGNKKNRTKGVKKE